MWYCTSDAAKGTSWHRVKRVKNGIYTVLGDAQSICEDGITEGDIKAVAVGAIHRGKKCLPGSFRWFFYKTFWAFRRAAPQNGIQSIWCGQEEIVPPEDFPPDSSDKSRKNGQCRAGIDRFVME